jgi:UDP-N-acetylmuramoyl-tripeptide--D-alanyl-D-alanine ligase
MLELGDKEVEYHVEIAKSIDTSKIHSVFTFGNLSKVITDTLCGSFFEGKVKHFTSKTDLADECLRILDKNDVILVKGSRGLKLEDVCYIINN